MSDNEKKPKINMKENVKKHGENIGQGFTLGLGALLAVVVVEGLKKFAGSFRSNKPDAE